MARTVLMCSESAQLAAPGHSGARCVISPGLEGSVLLGSTVAGMAACARPEGIDLRARGVGGAGQDALMKGSASRCRGRFGGLLEDPFGQYTQLADLALVQLAGEVALHRVGECRLGGGEDLFALGGERGVDGPPV